MTEVPKLNGKNWLAKGLIQIILVLSLVAYSAVLTVKEFSGGSKVQPTQTVVQDPATIERLARIEERLNAVSGTVDKIEKKLDSHIDKQK